MSQRLTTRLFAAFAAIVVAFAAFAIVVGFVIVERTVVREARASLRLDLRAAVDAVDTLRDQWTLLADVLGRGRRVASALDAPRTLETIRDLEAIRLQAEFDVFEIVDLEGRVLVRSTPPYSQEDFVSHAVVREALAGRTNGGFIELDEADLAREGAGLAARARDGQGLLLLAAAPAFDAQGGRAGAVVAGVLVDGSESMARRLAAGAIAKPGKPMDELAPSRDVVAIYHREACALTTATDERAGGPRQAPAMPASMRDAVLDRNESWFSGDRWTEDWLAAAMPITTANGFPCGAIVVRSPRARFATLRWSLAGAYGANAAVAIVLMLAVSHRLAGRLAAPLARLSAAAARIEEGNWSLAVEDPRDDDEVATLTRAFSRMTRSLAANDAQIRVKQAELAGANRSLTAANEAYLNMLGFVSHELKNVLGTISWSAHALDDGLVGAFEPRQAQLIGAIRRAVDRALALCRNYLDLARIENGTLELARARCDLLTDVVQPVVDELGDATRAVGMRVAVEAGREAVVSGDVTLLRIVLRNLLGNALRYGRRGTEIRVRCGLAECGAEIFVWNEGEGLEREQLERLFGKFTRFERGGSGLGLFIVREIVERHGGTVTADSKRGEWISFTVIIPSAIDATWGQST